MSEAPRNRIVRHVRMRAGDLVPHELNPRVHPQTQRQALAALYREIGFARSLLAYELPDGRLKLIDGHLRQQLDPDQVVEVEVLDLEEEEARKLLLSLDPLASLANVNESILARLREQVSSPSDALTNLWRSLGTAQASVERTLNEAQSPTRPPRPLAQQVPAQWMVLIECSSEADQVALLERFQREGLRCRALLS
jgi:hypothetical protein